MNAYNHSTSYHADALIGWTPSNSANVFVADHDTERVSLRFVLLNSTDRETERLFSELQCTFKHLYTRSRLHAVNDNSKCASYRH